MKYKHHLQRNDSQQPRTLLLELPDAIFTHILSYCTAVSLALAASTSLDFLCHLEHAVHLAAFRLGMPLPRRRWSRESFTHRLAFLERLARRQPQVLAAGAAHTLCVGQGGVAFAWGGSEQMFVGHLGHGELWGEATPYPRPLLTIQTRVLEVAAGGLHSLLLAEDDAVYSFGCGSRGQLGHGDTEPQAVPRRIKALEGQRIVQVACGHEHSLVLTGDGGIRSFGRGSLGQLGLGDMSDKSVPTVVEMRENDCYSQNGLILPFDGRGTYGWYSEAKADFAAIRAMGDRALAGSRSRGALACGAGLCSHAYAVPQPPRHHQ